jgi:hypothetical protein
MQPVCFKTKEIKVMTHILKIRAHLLFTFVMVLIQSLSFAGFIASVQAQQQHSNIIRPQGTECTYIGDVDRAGTVRVNNLANLEALLNIIANGAEMVGLLFGLALIIRSLLSGRPDLVIPLLKWKLNRRVQFAIGCAMILIGLAVPDVVNWLVASGRDIEYFS